MKNYTLLAGAAVFALFTTGAKAVDINTGSTTTLTANIDLVGTVTMSATPLDFGKFVSIPGQTITLSSDYSIDGYHAFTTSLSGGLTVPADPGDEESQPVTYSAIQLGTPTPGVITLTSQGMDFTYTYNNDNPDGNLAPDYLLGVFDLEFEDIDMVGPNGVPCGTVTPIFDTYAYNYAPAGDNYDKDYSTMYIGGRFTQADANIHGSCTGQGTVTLIIHD